MGDPPGGPDPRFDEAYWVEATTKAALYLRNYIGGDHGRAWECVGRAVQRARPGGDQAWDPGKYAKLSVYLYYRGRTMVVPVIDRGPYANHADWDLTEATDKALGIPGTATIGAVSLPPHR